MKPILVTGSSSGIGQACALRLARAGHLVFAGVRDESDGKRLQNADSGRVVPVTLDVTDQDQIDALAERITDEVGELGGVVNNAGIALGGPLEYLPIDVWRDQLEVNVFGQVAVTRAMLPLIREGGGRIVFIGSIGGKVATMMMGPYNASKFAIEAIGASLRQELRPWGIGVSVVEPGAIKTEIWGKGRETADRLEKELPVEGIDRYGPQIASIRKGIDMQDRLGIGPEKVAVVVEHALRSSRPKHRYLVGKDARIQSAMVRLLSDRAREAIVRQVAGR